MKIRELSNREIQLGSYEILKKLADICEKQGFTYFLTYGTLIGAVRHKGIIPWDDDIDIMMPRPDYEKLIQYFNDYAIQLEPLKLFDPNSNQDYPHRIIRISDQRYHLIFDNERDYGIGLFVDIYPLDGVGNSEEEAIKLTRKLKKYASMCFLTSRKRFSVDNTNSIIKMIVKVPAYAWAKLRGNKYYLNMIQKLAQTYEYESSKYVACAAWPAGKKYGRERDVFEKRIFDVIYADFEDSKFCIPIGYDYFLRVTYGDYMIPPKEEGKKTHHTYKAYKVKEVDVI